MRVMCAWCGCLIKGSPDTWPVSHGICSNCYAQSIEDLMTIAVAENLPDPFEEWQDTGGEGGYA